MRSDTSETGTRFNSERDSLFRRWERILHVLAYHHVRDWGGPAYTPMRRRRFRKDLKPPSEAMREKGRSLAREP
jgi:hypothetical protein